MAAAKKKTTSKVIVADKKTTRQKIASAKSAASKVTVTKGILSGNRAIDKTVKEVTKNWTPSDYEWAGKPYKGHEGETKGAMNVSATKAQWAAGKVSAKTGEKLNVVAARIQSDRSKTAGRAKNVERKLNKKAGK